MQAIDINGKHHDISPDEVTWRPSVYGVVVRDGKILLSPQHGFGYDLPGGGMELGEAIQDALVREVKEETGMDVKVGKLLHATDNLFVWKPDDPTKRNAMHSILLFYECTVVGGEISTDGFDEDEQEYAEQAEWVPLDALDSITPAASYDWREIVRQVVCS